MSVAPIGVFDSGVGGISVLRELCRELPHEHFIYYADSGHCPYGGKPREAIIARADAITQILLARAVKLIVVACNTATIAAVEHLRSRQSVPFIGMEPALKPAVERTRSGVVGVLATGAALGGEKFHRLMAAHARDVRVITQPCPGLVEQVECGDLDGATTRALVRQYVEPLLAQSIDTLVLGCTHYPFLKPLIAEIAGAGIELLDTGAAVAQHTRRVLERGHLVNTTTAPCAVEWHTSGDAALFARLREHLIRI